jgi:hypothetical protein
MMNILDNIEEYTKLKTTFDRHFSSNIVKKDDLDTSLEDVKTDFTNHKLNLETRFLEISNNIKNNRDELNNHLSEFNKNLNNSNQVNVQLQDSLKNLVLQLNHTNEQVTNLSNKMIENAQNVDEYKKITNDRIEKLVKLFLSINK